MSVAPFDNPVSVTSGHVPPLGWPGTLALFGGAALLMLACTHGIIPALAEYTSIESFVGWLIVGGLGVFLPLILTGLWMLAREGALTQSNLWRGRLRFRRMNAGDWAWSIGGSVVISLLSAITVEGMVLLWGDVPMKPWFVGDTEPLGPGRYWIIAVWLPYWLLNILGEEFIWRGVVLPRHEAAFGRWGWAVNGFGWGLFHLAFGLTILLVLWPTLYVLPYICQRRQNSWVGVVIHAAINGPGFLVVAFGLI